MSTYDPSLLHYWTEVRPRGEWPTTVIAPACTPTERRTVPVDVVDDNEGAITDADPVIDDAWLHDATYCSVCVTVMQAVRDRVGAS